MAKPQKVPKVIEMTDAREADLRVSPELLKRNEKFKRVWDSKSVIALAYETMPKEAQKAIDKKKLDLCDVEYYLSKVLRGNGEIALVPEEH
jgi:hypothetical protein